MLIELTVPEDPFFHWSVAEVWARVSTGKPDHVEPGQSAGEGDLRGDLIPADAEQAQ